MGRDTKQEKEIEALRQRSSVADVLDHWAGRLFGLLVVVAGGGASGAALMGHAPPDAPSGVHDQIDDLKGRIDTQGPLIGDNHGDVLALEAMVDELAKLEIRRKAVENEPRPELRSQSAEEAVRRYEHLVEDGMKRDRAMIKVLYDMVR